MANPNDIDVKTYVAFEYVVSTTYLSYLINDDSSGLDEDELEKVDRFSMGVQKHHGYGHWDYETHPTEEDEELLMVEGFDRCEISGLMANCAYMRYNRLEQKQIGEILGGPNS